MWCIDVLARQKDRMISMYAHLPYHSYETVRIHVFVDLYTRQASTNKISLIYVFLSLIRRRKLGYLSCSLPSINFMKRKSTWERVRFILYIIIYVLLAPWSEWWRAERKNRWECEMYSSTILTSNSYRTIHLQVAHWFMCRSILWMPLQILGRMLYSIGGGAYPLTQTMLPYMHVSQERWATLCTCTHCNVGWDGRVGENNGRARRELFC